MSKKSFILHLDSLSVLDELTDEQAGKLFKAIKEYQAGNTTTEHEFWLKIAFLPFRNQFSRDAEKYEEFVEAQSIKGKLSAQKRKAAKYNQIQPLLTAVDSGQPSATDSTYNDSVSVSDSVNDSESVNITRTPDFFQFSFSKTQFEHLPEEFQSQTDKENWVKWQNLNEHIDRNLKEIRKIEQQMNHKEYLNFKEKYIGKNKLALNTVLKLLENFNNHRQAAQKYLAVYPALCKWADIELSQKQSSVVNQ